MFTEERRQAILATLASESRVEVAALARRFKVSVDTVRRDLRALASTGVTWTDPRDAAALRDALATRKVENVMLVSSFMAAAASLAAA